MFVPYLVLESIWKPWSLSRESFIPAETITGSKLETVGEIERERKKEIKKPNPAPFSCFSIQFRVVGNLWIWLTAAFLENWPIAELSCELIHLSCWGLEGSQGRQEIIGCRILVCVSGPGPPIPEHRWAGSLRHHHCWGWAWKATGSLAGGGRGPEGCQRIKFMVSTSLRLQNHLCREMVQAKAQTHSFVLTNLILYTQGWS